MGGGLQSLCVWPPSPRARGPRIGSDAAQAPTRDSPVKQQLLTRKLESKLQLHTRQAVKVINQDNRPRCSFVTPPESTFNSIICRLQLLLLQQASQRSRTGP